MPGTNAVMLVPVPQALEKGLVFVKETDILMSGDKWTIVVNITLDDYATLVDVMKTTMSQVRYKIQVHKNPKSLPFDINWGEIKRLDIMVQELDNDLRRFPRFLFEGDSVRGSGSTRTRSKRGLLNVLGYRMKYLFGTGDARGVQRLTNVCNKLHAFESRMTHAVDHQLMYIQTLDEVTHQNTRDIVTVTEVLRDSIRNFSLQLNRVEANLLDTQVALEKQAWYSAAIKEIEMAILELKFSVMQLQELLDVTSMSQLSSVLINPYNLSVILQQVSLQLPTGLSMLTGLTVEEMYVYYTISTVHAVATSKSIRLFIDIPLKAVDRYFELYQFIPFLSSIRALTGL